VSVPAAVASTDSAGAQPPRIAPPPSSGNSGLVARNTLALVLSQFVTTPVSMIVNAILARSLGATDFGIIYFATTSLLVAFLFVEWGGQFSLVGEVARNRSRAGELFAAAAAQRLALATLVILLIPRAAALLGYDDRVQQVLLLCAARMAVGSIATLCSATFRGFEKLAWCARLGVLGNLLEAGAVIPTLLLGGGLRAALIAQLAGCTVSTAVHIALVVRLGIGLRRPKARAVVEMFHGGLGFLILDLVLRLQPYIDATFLSRLARPEAMGWYSAGSRIVGVLLFPATTLSFAIYPTISRLWAHDEAAYAALMRLAIRTIAILGILAATGTALFADVAVGLVYGDRFGPTAGNLRILAVYVVLVFTSVILGIGIAAAKRQMRYAVAQSFCLVVSLALDPILVPYFERTAGNGGLGVSSSVAIAEIMMVVAGGAILPRGVLDRSLLATAGRAFAAGLAMAAAGFFLRSMPAVAIPVSVAIYAAVIWALGGLDAEMIGLLRDVVRRKRGGGVPVAPLEAAG
jgi:O-antigen/teichoic acid export membrane protein